MSMEFLAQLSARDELIFRILLIPGGLWLLAIGIRAIRRRELHLRKRSSPITGNIAMILGAISALIGLVCLLAAIRSLWQ